MFRANDLRELKAEEKRIIQEAKRIEEAEKRIDREEKGIIEAEKTVIRELKSKKSFSALVDSGLKRRELLRLVFVGKIARKHKFLFTLIATIGIVLVWRGVWHTADEIPILSYSLVSLFVGIGILWLVRKYTDLL